MDAVICFSRSGRRLRIVGDGPEYAALRKAAKSNVEFCGRISDSELREQYAHCRAFVQPAEEDFGIVSVEALSSGKPVIGLGRGGLTEIAPERDAGFLYPTPDSDLMEGAIERFEDREPQIRPTKLQVLASQYSEESFAEKILSIVNSSSASPDIAVSDPVGRAIAISRSA
jgi:glycosyltransferase involved in cell wall biosynthesis